jgi:hypothetical protein
MTIAKIHKRRRIRLHLLMIEINGLKKRMLEVYEQSGNLQNLKLIQLSEILDQRLNQFSELTKTQKISLAVNSTAHVSG